MSNRIGGEVGSIPVGVRPPSTAKPIKTVLLSTLYPSSVRPRHGIFVETRLRHLLATGEVESNVVAPVPWFPSSQARYGKWGVFAATPLCEVRNGIRVKHPRYFLPPKIGMSIGPLALALGAYATIARLIKEEGDFDIIDAHYYYPDGAAAALLAARFDKPFVVTARGTDLNLLPNYYIPRRWIRWTEARAAASVTVSRSLARRLEELGGSPDRIRILPNGVDLTLFRLLDRGECRAALMLPNARWLLSVGNLVRLKGHDVAIGALTNLPEGFRLAIIGEGEDRGRLEATARRLGVADRVSFIGTLPQPELVSWYNAADVLVLCSSREGLPNVLLEALACGTPVVAPPVGGVPEVVQYACVGRLLRDRTPAALATAVLDILSYSADRSALRTFVSRFDWEEISKGQIQLFRQVMERRRAMQSRRTEP